MSAAAKLRAGVAGRPIGHSLSPAIHGAWIEAAGLDATYEAFEPAKLASLVETLRAGGYCGLNVTAPFKIEALAAADRASARAVRAGAANLLVFGGDGGVSADNTDGEGLLGAFAEQAPGFDPAAGPVVIFGAGGAARGAATAMLDAGAPVVRIVNRSASRAAELVRAIGDRALAISWERRAEALADAVAIVNATPASPDAPLEAAPPAAVVMDMVYRPVKTAFLQCAECFGLRTVDGLAMLIAQARPSFHALFGLQPPDLDIRARVLERLESGA